MDDKKFDKTVTLLLNFTNILTSMGMMVFGDILQGFVKGMGNLITDVLAGGKDASSEKVKEAVKQMEDTFPDDLKAEVKRNINSTDKYLWPAVRKHEKRLKEILTDDVCDEVLGIVDKYDFNVSKLYMKLDEKNFMGYLSMIMAENEKLQKMFEEIMGWWDKNGAVVNEFASYLPSLTTDLGTGEVRAGPSKYEESKK